MGKFIKRPIRLGSDDQSICITHESSADLVFGHTKIKDKNHDRLPVKWGISIHEKRQAVTLLGPKISRVPG